MLTNHSMTRKAVAILMLAVAGFHAPAYAGDVEDCLNHTLELCDEVLEECNWLEKVAIGFTCSVMLAACAGESISISLS